MAIPLNMKTTSTPASAKDMPADPAQGDQTPASREERINIMIVDDEPRNLTVLETVLEDPGYRLVRAVSAEEALLALVTEEFALLILDIQMPGMTGFELAQMIKDRKKTARIPIIFLTAYYNEDQHVLEGYCTGAVDYLHKPVNAAILRSKVAVFAELHRATRQYEQMNCSLLNEVAQRRLAEQELRELNESLEQLVAERTEVLVEAKERAEAASRAKDDFLAALSHELRTPLNPVLMAATALAGDPALPVEARGQLDMMRRNIELEARLIDDLLDISRINHGKLIITTATTDVHELLNHADEIVRSDGFGKTLSKALKLDAARHHTLADPARLQQVFWNLLRNAEKFTPRGGTITVSTRNDADGKILISVADDGIGIRTEILAKIFNAFEQGDTSGQHHYGGLGLGLAISGAIVTAHGGLIRADSEGAGRGATFTVTLDTVAAPSPSGEINSTQIVPASSLALLIVEDHEASLMMLEHLLTLSGHRVTTASTVRDALHAYKAADFDAVISDLGLPDGSGFDLMTQIQSIRPVPAIALSGYGMEEDQQGSKEAGFFAHLVKPVKLDDLKQVLGQLAGIRDFKK